MDGILWTRLHILCIEMKRDEMKSLFQYGLHLMDKAVLLSCIREGSCIEMSRDVIGCTVYCSETGICLKNKPLETPAYFDILKTNACYYWSIDLLVFVE